MSRGGSRSRGGSQTNSTNPSGYNPGRGNVSGRGGRGGGRGGRTGTSHNNPGPNAPGLQASK